jgi:N-methylhydantoinase A
MRFAVDVGGTFTDLVIEGDDGAITIHKAPTTPHDPVQGVLEVVARAAAAKAMSSTALLGTCSVFMHGTTRAINAVLTGTTAKTALLATRGHPDMLLLREGGRREPFNWTHGYPDGYIPRALTFEIPERIGSQGEVVLRLDEKAVIGVIDRLEDLEVEAVAVCLLWSIANPDHELRIGALLDKHLPGIPYTLSHQLNPTLREYRRASSTAIDASLKPLMASYLAELETSLRKAGFAGRLLTVTSSGGMIDAADMAAKPIHSINSGPSMAPIAGRYFAELDGGTDTAVISDTGGTSYDVSLVRKGRVPFTRETWLGQEFSGHITGFPAVDVRSIGAGGGSIAWIDPGGLLRVGPQSAGADPGPVCYSRGATEPTVTDACLVLGYIDPDFFLGGAMVLDKAAAERAVRTQVALPLGLELSQAAAAIMAVTTERMVQSIEEITIMQGLDPRQAVLVGGGGAAGLNAVAIARRLGCRRIVIPDVGAALSAAGALMSDLQGEFSAAFFSNTADFDVSGANRILEGLGRSCDDFVSRSAMPKATAVTEFIAEARYSHQVWQIEVTLRTDRFRSGADVKALVQDFHALHEEIYATRDERSPVEIVNLRARVRCPLPKSELGQRRVDVQPGRTASRRLYFRETGPVDAEVWRLEAMAIGHEVDGPAVIESPFTTIVVDPGASAVRRPSGTVVIAPGALTESVRGVAAAARAGIS